jgi:hypothetical protein
MGRKARRIEGFITNVREVERHKNQYRIRFVLNGVPSETYRAKKEDAHTVQKDLATRAILADSRERTAVTWLSAEQLKQAEVAFQILGMQKLINLTDDDGAQMIVIAAQKFAEAVKKQGPPITIAKAYEQFIAHQTALPLSKKTLLDYERYVGKGFITQHGEEIVYQLTPQHCYKFVMGYASQLDRFKSYGYLYAFLNFCTGKKNPAIDPTKDKPWLARNPVNFPKPVYELKAIESYTLAEIKQILRKAYETGSLGYIIFRLFTLCRYEELQRLVSFGGSSQWDTNKLIDLRTNQIDFTSDVYRKRSNGQQRGRIIRIERTFRIWIDFCRKRNLGFTYNRVKDENARKAIPDKFGKDEGHSNLLRHTAITFHVKAHKNPADTAYIAGTSTEKIDSNYYNARLREADARAFYLLTPEKLGLI